MPSSSEKKSASHPGHCQRCGTCCQKGGPALHIEDQGLVESGKIALKHLMTIRQGEPALDNVAGTIAPAVTDIIRLKGVSGSPPQCVLYEAESKRCCIYTQRPVECAALKCWDTAELEDIYRSRRLTRRHLLAKIEGLWELVEDHQARCDYGYVAELADQFRQQSSAGAAQKLLELVHYDDALRTATVTRAGHTAEILEFLFGRPLSFTIQLFQLKLAKDDQKVVLVPTEQSPMCYRRQSIQ